MITYDQILGTLRNHVTGWRQTKGFLVLETDMSDIVKEIYVTSSALGSFSFDQCIEMSSIVGVCDNLPPEKATLYRTLKSMEIELAWRGIFFRRPFFKPARSLEVLRNRIPDLKFNSSLAEEIIRKKEIMHLINKVKPELLSITLESTDEFIALSTHPSEGEVDLDLLIDIMKEYYDNPCRIAWFVTIGKTPTGFSIKGDLTGMFKLIIEISEFIFNWTKIKINEDI